MTVTAADILNRALQLIGGFNNQGPVTGSPPTFDGSPAGVAGGTLYQAAVQTVARQFGWDFSRNVVALVLTTDDVPLGYAFGYFYPTNGIQVRQLVPATIEDANDPRPIRWTVGNAVVGLTKASGSVFFASNPNPGDTVTLNGVVYNFVASGGSGTSINIGGTTAITIGITLLAALQTSTNPLIDVATYGATGGPGAVSLTIEYNTNGTAGNAYTLAASAATRSGPTLTGGTSSQQKVIWTNLEDAQATFTNQPTETTWDAEFAEAVVRLLASELALALDGKPETAAALIQQSAAFEQMGEQRTDS